MPRLRLVPDLLQKFKGRTKEALAAFRDNGFAQGFQLFLAVHQDEDAAPESDLTMVTDPLERHTNVAAGIVPASPVCTVGRRPGGANGALVFGDVVVVHAPVPSEIEDRQMADGGGDFQLAFSDPCPSQSAISRCDNERRSIHRSVTAFASIACHTAEPRAEIPMGNDMRTLRIVFCKHVHFGLIAGCHLQGSREFSLARDIMLLDCDT